MFLTLDLDLETPIYTQIRNQVIRAIATNQLKEGDSLPSVRQMASDLGVNLHTINKAYNILKQDGFLTVNKRKGAVINSSDKYAADNEYYNNLRNELEVIIAEAVCRGLDYEDICKSIKEIINDLKLNERKNNNE